MHIAIKLISVIIAILLLNLAGLNLKFYHQIYIAWGIFSLAIILNLFDYVKRPPLRMIFIIMISFVSMRYWYWRTFETLIFTEISDSFAMMVLYLAECHVIAIHFLGIFTNIWPLKRKITKLPDNQDLYPTVDVLIPTYNEGFDIIRITVSSASQIDYPKAKLRIHVLDDGSTLAKRNNPECGNDAWRRYYGIKDIVTQYGANYITRETNSHGKAGNINHALHYTNSDLLLILDCDHAPTKDILKNTVGSFFNDKRLFLVQTPHFFINPNPLEKNLDVFEDVPNENDMFYHSVHHGLDSWNASFFCGSAAVLRRKYLEEIGGISIDTITEDAETALSLHCKGYNSAYIDRPMVCGLSPELFDDYVVQRSRWAQGMIQIFLLKNPLGLKGLKMYQRFSYLCSIVFWLFGFSRFVFFISPAAFLIFGLKIYHASMAEVVAYALPHVLCSFVLTNFFYGKVRLTLFSELYESIQSIFLIPVILSVIRNPTAPTFKVTPKGNKLESDFLSPLVTPYVIMFLIIVASMCLAVIKWINYPEYRAVIAITFSWTLFNLLLCIASLGAFFEKRQIRNHHRISVNDEDVTVYIPRANQFIRAKIKEVSFSGIGIVLLDSYPIESNEEAVLYAKDSYGKEYKLTVTIMWHSNKENVVFCGCKYKDIKKDFNQIVSFVYGDSQRWQDILDRKAERINTMKIMISISLKGIVATYDCFSIIFHSIHVKVVKVLQKMFAKDVAV